MIEYHLIFIVTFLGDFWKLNFWKKSVFSQHFFPIVFSSLEKDGKRWEGGDEKTIKIQDHLFKNERWWWGLWCPFHLKIRFSDDHHHIWWSSAHFSLSLSLHNFLPLKIIITYILELLSSDLIFFFFEHHLIPSHHLMLVLSSFCVLCKEFREFWRQKERSHETASVMMFEVWRWLTWYFSLLFSYFLLSFLTSSCVSHDHPLDHHQQKPRICYFYFFFPFSFFKMKILWYFFPSKIFSFSTLYILEL